MMKPLDNDTPAAEREERYRAAARQEAEEGLGGGIAAAVYCVAAELARLSREDAHST